MLEWYRANADYEEVIADTLALVALAAETTGIACFSFRGRQCDPRGEAERLTVAQAFERYAGIDLMASLSRAGEGDRAVLAPAAQKAGITVAADDTWSDIFSKVLVAKIESELGLNRPTVLYEYPRCEAALARASEADPRVAERFELYACGVELANGFGELIDPFEQKRRFEQEMAEKERVYGERYPIDEEFLAALAQMPPSSGVALGFDRLVLLAAGARTLDDVIWTPAP
jgi:lysyl-tRNA synthetase class 2